MATDSTSKTKKDLFKDVRFFLAEENNEEVKQVLKSGGAAREFYISDLVTHVISSGNNFPQCSEAKDYNLTIVQPKWVFLSARCEMLLPCGAFQPGSEQFFKGIVVCPSQIPINDRDALWAMVTYYGGQCQLNLNSNCTHLVIPLPSGPKYDCALKHSDCIKIVTPGWIVDSIKEKKKLDEANYKPSRAENKPETETTSTLLTPDDNNRTTTTPLPATVLQVEPTTPSTPIMDGAKAVISLPSALMSPESPVVITSSEANNTKTTTVQSQSSLTISAAEGEKTTDTNIATTPQEKKDTEPKPISDVSSGSVKIVENNNEEIVEDEKENEEQTSVQIEQKTTENEESNCLANCVFVITDYPDRMEHTILGSHFVPGQPSSICICRTRLPFLLDEQTTFYNRAR